MKATDYIARQLADRGVSAVFEMSGGMITHLLDSIHQYGKTRIVSSHHEQASAFAAEGYGRMTGVPGVALATSGPGATNLLTGIGSCFFDSTPTVFITGQVNRHEQKGDRAIRQLGFQETDIVSMAKPITKLSRMITDASQIPDAFEEAFEIASEGRPGPVLLDIPMDVQRCDVTDEPTYRRNQAELASEQSVVKFLAEYRTSLSKSQFPLVLLGGGVQSSRSQAEIQRLVELLGVPVVHSLMGVDILPYDHPLRMGMIGTYGNRWANLALAKSDTVMVLGSRLDVRQTGSDTATFASGKQFFHVDCEAGEMNNRVQGCTTCHSTLSDFANIFNNRPVEKPNVDAWLSEIQSLRRQWPDEDELTGGKGINPNSFMHTLSAHSRQVNAFVVDVGQHQMWAAQSIRLTPGQRFLTSGGMGAMGFALPTAIGASISNPDGATVVIAGDGGFQTNIHELETIRRYKLPIKMVILNNQCHGMVRQLQESYFEGRYQSTLWGYSAPDFAEVGNAYGISSHTCETTEELESSVQRLMQDPKTPGLLQVMIDTFANAYPKIAFGRPITDMEPFFKPIEMEST